MDRNGINIVDLMYLVYKKGKRLILWTLSVCLITLVISFCLPRVFFAETTILPPVEDNSTMGISSFLKNIPVGGLGMDLNAVSGETSIFIAIVNSRSVMESVVNKFDLIKRYKAKNIELAVKQLRKNVSIRLNEEGTISVGVKARTRYFPNKMEDEKARELARDMDDHLIQELDRINKRLKTERAGNTRRFIEKRYLQNLDDLKAAEESYRAFQKKYGAVSLPDQTTALVNTMAKLKAEMIAKEIELDVLQNNFGSSNAEIIKRKQELSGIQNKYQKLVGGRISDMGARAIQLEDVLPAFSNLPDLGMNYARLLRDVMIQEKIMEFLLPQYEEAKIQEAKDTPTVQVLDPPNKPINKIKPRRMIMVVIAGFCCFLFLVCFELIRENIEYLKAKDRDKYDKLVAMNIFMKKNTPFRPSK